MAAGVLAEVAAPTLLIVGEADSQVLTWNRESFAELRGGNASKLSPRRPIFSKNRASSKRLRGWQRDGLSSISSPQRHKKIGKERGSSSEGNSELCVSRNDSGPVARQKAKFLDMPMA